MSQALQCFVKWKAFSKDPRLLQELIDDLRHLFGKRITISTIMPASEGDYFAYFTLYAEALR